MTSGGPYSWLWQVPRNWVTQATKHHGAQLELDPLRHAEPMKFSQSAVVFPCFGDDTSDGVEHPLQLVCGGFWRSRTRRPWVPMRKRRRIGWKYILSSSDSGVWESVMSSPSGVWCGAPAEMVLLYFNLCRWQQILQLFVLKSEGYCTPQSKKCGYRYDAYVWDKYQ